MTIREALLAMGYQELKPGRWLKPVGWHAFAYDENVNKWVNVCRLATGEIGIYEDTSFRDEDEAGSPIRQLKNWEAFARTNVAASMPDSSNPIGSELHIGQVIDYGGLL